MGSTVFFQAFVSFVVNFLGVHVVLGGHGHGPESIGCCFESLPKRRLSNLPSSIQNLAKSTLKRTPKSIKNRFKMRSERRSKTESRFGPLVAPIVAVLMHLGPYWGRFGPKARLPKAD